MPLIKDYYRFLLDGIFNLSVSSSCNVLAAVLPSTGGSSFDLAKNKSAGKRRGLKNGVGCAVFGFAEYACLWDTRRNVVVSGAPSREDFWS